MGRTVTIDHREAPYLPPIRLRASRRLDQTAETASAGPDYFARRSWSISASGYSTSNT